MDLFDVVRSCIRRWYIVLPLLLLVALYSHHMYQRVKPVYYSNAVVGVALPNSHMDIAVPGLAVPRNGLVEGGGVTLIANMLQINLSDPSVAARVVTAGGQANYSTKMFPSAEQNIGQLPLVMIEATELDPASAAKTVELVVSQADPTLRTLQQQAGVADDQMVTSFVASPPSVPAAGIPSAMKSTMTLFVAGAGLAILVGVVVDVLLMRWRPRRQKRRQTWVQTAAGADRADGARNVHPQDEHAAADDVAVDSR